MKRITTGGWLGQVDATVVPRLAGPPTFARLPRIHEVSDVDVAVLGIPFDAGVSYRPGARFRPVHVRESSWLLRPYNPVQDVEPFGSQQVVDAGDLAVNPFDIEDAIASIVHGARSVLERTGRLLTIGGDHTVALPLLRAMSAVHGPLAVVHFDAHLDTWDTYFGAAYTRARRSGGRRRRSCSTRPAACTSASADRCTPPGTCSRTPSSASRSCTPGRSTSSGSAASSFGSGPRRRTARSTCRWTSTSSTRPSRWRRARPRAGGLSSQELLAILREFEGLNLVGADLVEVAPVYNHAEITGIAAAHTAYELVSVMAPRQ